MKKVLKWLGIIVLLVIIFVAYTAWSSISDAEDRLAKTYEIQLSNVSIPTDSASIAIGNHWAIVSCTECHGMQLEGKVMFEEESLAKVVAPNLTPGKGGIGTEYTNEDWVRALRHGVGKDQRSLFIMPAKDYHQFSEYDLTSIVAYLKTIPAIDNDPGQSEFYSFGKLLLGQGAFGDIIAAETIDHNDRSYPPAPTVNTSASYGDYLVRTLGCRNCHGAQLNGGSSGDPAAPYAPNLTPNGHLKDWSAQQLAATLRTGKTPEGTELRNEYMPWRTLGLMTNNEIEAMLNYFHSLDPMEDAVLE